MQKVDTLHKKKNVHRKQGNQNMCYEYLFLPCYLHLQVFSAEFDHKHTNMHTNKTPKVCKHLFLTYKRASTQGTVW